MPRPASLSAFPSTLPGSSQSAWRSRSSWSYSTLRENPSRRSATSVRTSVSSRSTHARREIAFTAPYVLIEGFYLVRNESAIHSNAEVDAEINRVVVGKGSAYDLFLSRELKHAQIVRAPTSPTVVRTFIEQGMEVAAGVKQQLEADASKTTGLRLLDQRFMVIQQAMGAPKSRSDAAADVLRQFVEEMKASGFVAASLTRHGIVGASVAPVA